jgi:hypothetical protein
MLHTDRSLSLLSRLAGGPGTKHSTRAFRSTRFLFALPSVVLLLGCYNLSLNKSPNSDGSQDGWPHPGVEAGEDRAAGGM